jgi:hypothetical protein
MQTKQTQGPDVPGCGYIATERNRYFTGKFMTARDFTGEQEYSLSRHRLHNRLLHGWGIVCGLRVDKHPDPACANRWVVVRSGIAIDCCGRELILRQDTPLQLPLPTSPGDAAAGSSAQAMSGPFLLCLRYSEEEIEQVPALYAEGTCDPTRTEANRVREVAALQTIPFDQVQPGCWEVPGGDAEAPCRDDCDEEVPGPAGACLEPDCRCGQTVPLVLINFDPEHPEAGFTIDTTGQRTLPLPSDYLTHIVHINWPHGGEVTLSHLRGEMEGRLRVKFDRKLLPADGAATGISVHTFVVQYAGIERNVEFLPFNRHHPPTLTDDCWATFTIRPEHLEPEGETIAGNIVYVTLKCDFILDCHGNPVDGNHLRGRLPSGDGIPGGSFESWFRVVDENRRRRRDE